MNSLKINIATRTQTFTTRSLELNADQIGAIVRNWAIKCQGFTNPDVESKADFDGMVISEQSTSWDDSDEGWGGGVPQEVSVVEGLPQTDTPERIRLDWALSPTEPDSIRAISAPNLFTAEDVAAAVKDEREANLDILRTLISSAIAQEEMSYTERYREGCKMQQYALDLAVIAIAARGDHS